MLPVLFDQNLSPRLCHLLTDSFRAAAHVRDFNLQQADDVTVWEFARANGFAIVSKDSDFHQRSFVYGHPPKILWLRCGNASTTQIAALLRSHADSIAAFEHDESASFLIIS